MKYKPKYRITSDETLKGYEVVKLINNINQHEENRMFWKALPFILLVVFAVLAIIIMISNGGA